MTEPKSTRPSLILALRDASNEQAWSEFVALYTPLVFNHCLRRGLQEADAADVSQEVMRSVAGAIRRFDYDRRRGTFRSWLLTVTRSKLNNHFSGRARQPQGTGDTAAMNWLESQPAPAPAEDAVWEEEYRRHLFHHAANQIRDEFQPATWEAFWRTTVDEQPVAAVAANLGITAGAVYIARSRVVSRLREHLASIDDAAPLP